jgi:hypothetical protein
VREAITYLFDFEWINHSYFFDLYRRTMSYFPGSELSAHGRPADERDKRKHRGIRTGADEIFGTCAIVVVRTEGDGSKLKREERNTREGRFDIALSSGAA